MKPQDFSNRYSKGPKNCFDCKNFVCKIPINNSFSNPKTGSRGLIVYGAAHVRCRLNNLLIGVTKGGEIKEAAFHFSPTTWHNIKHHGGRHKDWALANMCEDFESMNDDE